MVFSGASRRLALRIRPSSLGRPGPGFGQVRSVQHVGEHSDLERASASPTAAAASLGTGFGQVRLARLVGEHPELELGVGVPRFGGPGVPDAGFGQVRRVQQVRV